MLPSDPVQKQQQQATRVKALRLPPQGSFQLKITEGGRYGGGTVVKTPEGGLATPTIRARSAGSIQISPAMRVTAYHGVLDRQVGLGVAVIIERTVDNGHEHTKPEGARMTLLPKADGSLYGEAPYSSRSNLKPAFVAVRMVPARGSWSIELIENFEPREGGEFTYAIQGKLDGKLETVHGVRSVDDWNALLPFGLTAPTG